MTDIPTLKRRAEEARTAATLAQRVYEQALCDAHPWQPGTVLRSKGGKEAKVLRLSMRDGAVYEHAGKRRADGTFGNGLGANRAALHSTEWRDAEVVA